MNQDENVVLPPYTNRGVGNTKEKSLTACVDWLQVTFKDVANPKNVIDLLQLKDCEFIPFDNGKYGYPYHLRFGHIAIYYGNDSEHVHLEMSGQGCREFEENGIYDWSVFLQLVLMLDVNIPRFDLAIDDKQGFFSFSTLKRKIKLAEVRSRFHTARVLDEYRLSDGDNLGTTIYFGSAQSEIQVRIYDKLKQVMTKKGLKTKIKRDEYIATLDYDKWIRTELQLRDERAFMAVSILASGTDANIGKQICGHLRNYILFVDNNGDKNKSRWPISRFWEKFLGEVDKLPLTQKSPDATLEKTKDWLEKSVAANLSMVLEGYEYNASVIYSLLIQGLEKRKKKHENMLARYKLVDEDTYNERMYKRDQLLNTLIELQKKSIPQNEMN